LLDVVCKKSERLHHPLASTVSENPVRDANDRTFKAFHRVV
jgi:hypothetical protein